MMRVVLIILAVAVMGPQWRPTGEWATWIDGLTKREAAE